MITTEIINIILPTFIVSLLIISTHIPLGKEVLERGIIFIDLAIAQTAALGIIIAKLYIVHYFSESHHIYIIQITALILAIAVSFIFMLCEKNLTNINEAIIGSVYIVTSSITLLLLANNPHGAQEIKNILEGQILWVNSYQIIIMAVIYGLLLSLWFFSERVKKKYFYFIFTIAITISVQLIGVYLVFASLVLPAIGAIKYKRKLCIGYFIAIISFILGIILSIVFDLPTGLLIICVLAAISYISYIQGLTSFMLAKTFL